MLVWKIDELLWKVHSNNTSLKNRLKGSCRILKYDYILKLVTMIITK